MEVENSFSRKSLSKKFRFEIFKRDLFKCQYCGRSAPEFVLEVDHLIPVSKGGSDDLINLVTACFQCNRGKSNIKLTDYSLALKNKNQLEIQHIKLEQLKMLSKWQKEITLETDNLITEIWDFWCSITGIESEHCFEEKRKIHSLLLRFDFQEIKKAMIISSEKYLPDYFSSYQIDQAFKKIGGICYNRSIQNG